VKTKGETYYVNHVTSNAPWSTKETPDNTHTKGSIKFKHVNLIIDDENCAEINDALER
jgi:formylmethanofuran dehydrogenase subunit D